MLFMIYQVTLEFLIDYFGTLRATLYDWKRKRIDVYLFYNELLKCESYKCQRDLFYKTLGVCYTENRIDVDWTRFINKQLEMEELEAEKRIKKNRIKKIKQDKKEGRII